MNKNVLTIILLVVFFPVGLYLMWAKTNWNKAIKIIISLFFLILFLFSLLSSGDSKNEIQNISTTESTTSIREITTTNQTTTANQTFNSSTETTKQTTNTTTKKEEELYFQYDSTVNDFFKKYNSIADKPISSTEIKKGNTNTKALVYIDDFSMEVLNTKQNSLFISISDDYKNEDTNLYDVFTNCIKAMDGSLSSDDIENAWNEIHSTGYMVENYDFNGIQITYVPYKELSNGHSNLRIDLTFSTDN